MSELFDSFWVAISYWWLMAIFFTIALGRGWWRYHIVDRYIDHIPWVLLELQIPKENLKSVKAMEQVIGALHGAYSFGLRFKQRWWEGVVEDWFSLEIVGFADGVHFYIRTPKKHRKLVESAVLSQYPGAEVFEVEDYVGRIKDKPFHQKDVWGMDFKLNKPDYYPIRTYQYFEDNQEEKRVDPLATVVEVMSSLNKNEALWLQLLIRPVGDEWRKGGEEKIKEISGGRVGGPAKGPSAISIIARDVGDVAKNLPTAIFEPPVFDSAPPSEPEKPMFRFRSPQEEDAMKAISNKLSKRAFEAILRFVYIDDREDFTESNINASMGALRYLGDQNLNSLVPNKRTLTTKYAVAKYILLFRKRRLAKRKRRLLVNYINREMPRPVRIPLLEENLKATVVCAEEIATLFHMPTDFVKSVKTQVTLSRKGQAPIDLPTKERT
ncbi:MAG: hypothetical protein A2Y84_00445 [Candidatus Colwellbacteria bacterium RBG_13_48_8]|uniref:DUF8128 domain-containing protein n=1 Tax=Candidatus Colwellbacteria bacterium RBG_13_48_8 TaxID=1797685 RepID=A0A1G1YV12_9BACT|nr:MAG: hypothetical protein A2Y84_00445 [Candidatus Colwellbacteria bacterium RBG_13_48_8]